jgi:hypothetical protein
MSEASLLKPSLADQIRARGFFYVRLLENDRDEFKPSSEANRFNIVSSALKHSILSASECRLFAGPGEQCKQLLDGVPIHSNLRGASRLDISEGLFSSVSFWADTKLCRGTLSWVIDLRDLPDGFFKLLFDPVAYSNPSTTIAPAATRWLRAKCRDEGTVGFALGSGISSLFVFGSGTGLESLMRHAFSDSRRSPHYEHLYAK